MRLSKTQVHTVRAGDTLSSIARQYGFVDWRKVYHAPVNESFRKTRPDPNHIRPGDKICIPADPKIVATALRLRVQKLTEVRQETIRLFDQFENELRREYRQAHNTGVAVDTAAVVSGLLVGQAGMIKTWRDALKLTGDDLAKLNRQLLRDHFLSPTSHHAAIAGMVGSVFDEPEESDGLAIAFGKIVLRSWSDMWSPSFWAGKISGQHPDQAFKEALAQIHARRQNTIASLDNRILKNQALLREIEKTG